MKKLKSESENDFYTIEQKKKISDAYKMIMSVYKEIQTGYYQKSNQNSIKNCIVNECQNYMNGINEKQTSIDVSISDYQNRKSDFVSSIMDCIKCDRKDKEVLKIPKIIKNSVDKLSNGYVFRRIAKYHDYNAFDDFLSCMFNNSYRNIQKIEKIDTKEKFMHAIAECTKISEIDLKWRENLKKFFDTYTKVEQFILEANTKKREGGTLGEISLTYYKYHLNSQKETDVIFIDQPEDNLSNNHISKELITYLNNLRRTKQIIFVTHNPLLLINLDVDNVIKVELSNSKLCCSQGCLEDEEKGILNYIANNMDGGKESIERRFKLYE